MSCFSAAVIMFTGNSYHGVRLNQEYFFNIGVCVQFIRVKQSSSTKISVGMMNEPLPNYYKYQSSKKSFHLKIIQKEIVVSEVLLSTTKGILNNP